MNDRRSDQERDGPFSAWLHSPTLRPPKHPAVTSVRSISKYITLKFLSSRDYRYRSHCKTDRESSLREVLDSSDVSDRLQDIGCERSPNVFWTRLPPFGTRAARLFSRRVCTWGVCRVLCLCVCVNISLKGQTSD